MNEKKINPITTTILIIGGIIIFAISLVNWVDGMVEEPIKYYCEEIDCGNMVLKDVEFEGSLLSWQLKNCRVINCSEKENE